MYCSVCGKSNPKDAGNPMPAVSPKERVEQLWRDYDAHFQLTICHFKSSPLAVVLAILFTLSIPVHIFSVADVIAKISSVEGRWGAMALILVLLGVLFNLVTLVSNLVVAICLWIQVAGGIRKKQGALKTGCLWVLTVINIISMVLCCIVWPLAYFSEGPFNNGLWDRLDFEIGNYISTIMYISMLLMIFYRLMIHKLLATMRGNTSGDSLGQTGIASVAAFQFLIGIGKGLVLVLWLANATSLTVPPVYLIFDTVIPILFGFLLIQYKATIVQLGKDYHTCLSDAARVASDASGAGAAKTGN